MRESTWYAVAEENSKLTAKLAALQSDDPRLQVKIVLPLGEDKAVIVYSIPV